MGENLMLGRRSANGVFIRRGLKNPVDVLARQLDPRTNLCRSMGFSNTGRYFAYCDSERTICVDTATGDELFAHPVPRTNKILFSPNDEFLVTFEPYVIYGSRTDEEGNVRKPDPNLRFFDTKSGNLLATIIQRNQIFWQPQFTEDGKVFVMVEHSEARFHGTSSDLDRYDRKAVVKGIENLKVSPGKDPVIAVFIPSKGGNANFISLRNFHGDMGVICQRSSFNADKCDFKWNSKGSAVLATTSVEVDKTNQSYYGVNCVYLLRKDGESLQVTLNKEGPVHAIEWSPSGNQFTVCYGFMPSNIATYNLKGTAVWNVTEGHFNELYYNKFGNILATCGFGNISAGKIQLWDTEKRSQIIPLEVPSTTYFEWAPDGQHFLTATTSPRLRIDNNYRIWSYMGELLVDEHMTETSESGEKKHVELAQVAFKPAPDGYQPFKIKQVTEAHKRSLLTLKNPAEAHPANSLQKAGFVSQNSKYVPPALRKGNAAAVAPQASNQNATQQPPAKTLTDDEKKLKQLKKKLADIHALKKRADSGEKLEMNQLSKLEKMAEIEAEIQKLTVGASP